MENGARKIVAKALFLGVLFYAISLALSFLFSNFFDWKSYQDPRMRLLYEPVDGDTGIILLGDSVWTSSYVNSEGDTLWKVLERHTGQSVFNATLNGADPPDFKNAVALLPNRRGKGAIAFLDVVPTRLLPRTYVEGATGNYAGEFARLVGGNFIERALVFLQKPLLIFNIDITLNCILQKKHFFVGDQRNRVWNKDGDFALKRFRTFERYLVATEDFRGVDWIKELDGSLGNKGYRFVIVVTPVNKFLVKEYSSRDKAHVYESRIDRAHEVLVRFLKENRIQYLDCYGDFDSDSFVDLIHWNAHGDRLIAEKMARFITSFTNESGFH